MTLFGFSMDSFEEIISGVGAAHMNLCMKHDEVSVIDTDRFEKQI